LDGNAPGVQEVPEGVPVRVESVADLDHQSAVDQRLHGLWPEALCHFDGRSRRELRNMSKHTLLHRIQLGQVRFEQANNIQGLRKQGFLGLPSMKFAEYVVRELLQEPRQPLAVLAKARSEIRNERNSCLFRQPSEDGVNLAGPERFDHDDRSGTANVVSQLKRVALGPTNKIGFPSESQDEWPLNIADAQSEIPKDSREFCTSEYVLELIEEDQNWPVIGQPPKATERSK
jgi:hypothetical protein